MVNPKEPHLSLSLSLWYPPPLLRIPLWFYTPPIFPLYLFFHIPPLFSWSKPHCLPCAVPGWNSKGTLQECHLSPTQTHLPINCGHRPLLLMNLACSMCFREREIEEVEAKGLAEGREKKETGCQYMLWAEKMSKTHMVEAWRDTGCSLHCIVPWRSIKNSLRSTLLQSQSTAC